MTSKKRRQRGSRTHGGGSHKNRRGAGNRGGRGNAGSHKHEFHNHEPPKKEGFNRPEKLQTDFTTVDLQKIDETIANIETGAFDIDDIEGVERMSDDQEENEMAADGGVAAMSKGCKYLVKLPQFSDDVDDFEGVKALANGYLSYPCNLVADEFSDAAKDAVESSGGRAIATNDFESDKLIAKRGKDKNNNNKDNHKQVELLDQVEDKVRAGDSLGINDYDKLYEIARSSDDTETIDDVYNIIEDSVENLDHIDAIDTLNLMRARKFAEEYGFDSPEIESGIDRYFEGMSASEERMEFLRVGLKDKLSVEDVLSGFDEIRGMYSTEEFESNEESVDEWIEDELRLYLFTIDGGESANCLLI